MSDPQVGVLPAHFESWSQMQWWKGMLKPRFWISSLSASCANKPGYQQKTGGTGRLFQCPSWKPAYLAYAVTFGLFAIMYNRPGVVFRAKRGQLEYLLRQDKYVIAKHLATPVSRSDFLWHGPTLCGKGGVGVSFGSMLPKENVSNLRSLLRPFLDPSSALSVALGRLDSDSIYHIHVRQIYGLVAYWQHEIRTQPCKRQTLQPGPIYATLVRHRLGKSQELVQPWPEQPDRLCRSCLAKRTCA